MPPKGGHHTVLRVPPRGRVRATAVGRYAQLRDRPGGAMHMVETVKTQEKRLRH